MNTLPCLRAETLSMIARLALQPEIFRSAQLANRIFHIDCAAQHHVRVRFRTLVASTRITRNSYMPNWLGIACSFMHKLPNGHQDGRTLALDHTDHISSVYMKNGVEHGINVCWSITSNGDGIYLLYRSINTHGIGYGNYTQWYPSGMLWVRGHYLDGMKHGTYSGWDQNGVLKLRHEYDMGRLCRKIV